MRRSRPEVADPLVGRWATVGGCRMFARVSACPPGGAAPIVLVHGLGVSSRYLVPTARRLAGRFPVFVPDLPGHGESERPPAALDVPGLGAALLAWLDEIGLGRVVLVGNSLGCQTIVDAALRRPERVLGLVLTGPTGDPAVRSLPRWLARLLRDLPREPFSLVPLEAGDYVKVGPRRVYRTAQAMVADPFAAKLARVGQPALVVRGGRDPIASQPWVEQVAALLPRGRLAVIPGAGHAVNYNAAAPLTSLVTGFVDELSAVSRQPSAGDRELATGLTADG